MSCAGIYIGYLQLLQRRYESCLQLSSCSRGRRQPTGAEEYRGASAGMQNLSDILSILLDIADKLFLADNCRLILQVITEFCKNFDEL